MAIIKVKGHEFNAPSIRDAFHRRAIQFRNNIIGTLKKIGLTDDDVDVTVELHASRKAPASATWYFEGYRLHYSYQGLNKFVENMFVVSKVIELEVKMLFSEEKSVNDFIRDFSEESDVKKQREEARELLGVKPGTLDLNLISKKYKELAKKYHPDMPGGNIDKFKAINRAHKILKRELE